MRAMSMSVGAAVVLAAAAQGDAPPELRQQAAQIKAFALEQIAQRRPQWTDEDRSAWAEAFERAILKHATEPLSEAHAGELRKAIGRCAEMSRKAMTRAWMPFAAMIYDFTVGDILAAPPPDAAEVEELKAQLSELSSWVAEELVSRIEVSAEAAQAGAAEAEAIYLKYIDEPKYRFDRRPMTDEQMQAARAGLGEAIDEQAAALPALEGPPGTRPEPPQFRERRARSLAKACAQHALDGAVRDHWRWRKTPETEEFKAARDRAYEAARALRHGRDIAARVNAAAGLLAAVALGPDPIGACPAGFTDALSAEAAAIVRRLRGPVGSARSVQYSADVEFLAPRTKVRLRGLRHFSVTYTVAPPSLRMRIVGVPDPELPEDHGLVDAVAVYDVGPAGAHVSSTAGDIVGTVSAGQTPTGTERKLILRPEVAAVPPTDLLVAAQMADPSNFDWGPTAAATAPAGIEVYEATARGPLSLPDIGEVGGIRYWFDAGRQSVVRAQVFDGQGDPLWETVYGALHELPDGSAVALGATTTLHPLALQRRREAVGRRPVFPPPAACVAGETVTEYRWFPEARLRLPVHYAVHGQQGLRECIMDFRDHEIEPLEGE
ncbi:MAG: hypothetical protein PVH68_16220 [Armatimonadota bacterium]|jgi:hypothetical protein